MATCQNQQQEANMNSRMSNSNSLSERKLIPVTKWNLAKYAAIASTLIECCKLHEVDPWRYLVDVLQRIDSHPAREVQMLTPKNWKVAFGSDGKDAT